MLQFRYLLVFLSFIILVFAVGRQKMSANGTQTSHIVFTSNVDYPDSESNSNAIYRIQSNGTGLQRIITIESRASFPYSISGVDCHANTQQLIIATNAEYSPYLYTANFDGSNLQQGMEVRGAVRDVSFSPDGQQVAFSSMWTFYSWDLEFEEDIYIADLRNRTYDIILRDVGTAYRDPQWSPNSTQIMYSYHPEDDAYDQDKHGIGIINVDKTDNDNILESTIWIGHPAWSPDGRYIVFSMEQNGSRHIFTMRSDGTELTQLTDEAGNNIRPRWSPDGNLVSFSSNRDRQGYQIYSMDKQGSNVRQITNNGADNYNQCWF